MHTLWIVVLTLISLGCVALAYVAFNIFLVAGILGQRKPTIYEIGVILTLLGLSVVVWFL